MAFPAQFDLSDLNGTNGFAINGINVDEESGFSVSNAGDVNGDNIDDVIIGAPDANAGKSYVVFGSSLGFNSTFELSSLNGSNGFIINGINPDEESGFSVSGGGDINGDGVKDLIIGAPESDANGTLTGQSYVVFGSSSPFNSSLDLSSLDGSNGFVINTIDTFDRLGKSVSFAGDINGDNIDDVIIHTGDTSEEESYVVFGSSSGFGSSFDLSSLDGSNGFLINNSISGIDSSNQSVSGAGDINGDGIDDLIVGSDSANPNGQNGAGETYVVFGSSSPGAFSSSLDPSSLNGSNGFVINGIDANDESGFSVSGAGDINGDGVVDLIIGAPDADPNASGSGESYVVFGSSSGFSSSLNLSSLNGSNGFIINGIDSGDESGTSVSGAGDINGDGIDDLIIGARFATPNGSQSGQSYVVFGSSSGFSSSLELSSLDGSNGFILNGIVATRAGNSVSNAGDINGDGVDDVIIGAPIADPNGIDTAGQSYVVFGNTIPIAVDDTITTSEDNALTGSVFADNGNGVDSESQGETFTVTEVNGTAADVSNQITLASSALLTLNSDGTFNYDPNGQFDSLNNGQTANDSFTYTISDGKIGSDTATVTISIDGFNDIPVLATNTGLTVDEDAVGNITATQLQVTDVDNTATEIIYTITNLPINGNLLLNGTAASVNDTFTQADIDSNLLTYDHNGSETTSDSFDFTVTDITTPQTFVITVNPVNDAPSVEDATFSIPENSAEGTSIGTVPGGDPDTSDTLTYTITAGNIDPDGDSNAAFAIDSSTGEITVADSGDLDFETTPNFNLTVTATDANGLSDDAAIAINLTDVVENTAPIANDDTATTDEDTSISISVLDLLANDTDLEGDSLTITEVDDRRTKGNITFDGVNITYNPNGEFEFLNDGTSRNDSFTYTISDGNGGTDTGTVNVTVNGVSGDIFPAFPDQFNLSDLNGSNGFVINGIDAGDNSGISVSNAGDINGDEIDDLIIGAYFADPNSENSGESYVVFGASSGFSPILELSSLDGSNGFVINGIDTGDGSGRSVSSAGDINGDGINDLIIGARGGDPNGVDSGESYVIFGSSSSFGSSLDLSSLDGSNGFIINGVDSGDFSGQSVSSAGDINGDGIDDLIIGANFADPNSTDSGQSYVIFGSSSGFGTSFELSSIDGSNGFVINGIDASDNSGISVSSAGDINSDGIDDLIIGADAADPNSTDSGQSYVIFGSSSGFGTSFELSSIDGSNGFVINGIDAGDNSGVSVSSAGDINGDGVKDLIIGAVRADSNGTDSGASYVVFGSSSGFGSSLELSNLDGSNGFVINGINGGDVSGTVSSAGDINKDGLDDLIIGALSATSNGNNGSGESYVVFGSSSGFSSSLELSSLNGSNGFIFNGIDAGDFSGWSVSSAGDINKDGVEDLIIGAPAADPNGERSGESYVVFGNTIPIAVDDTITASEDNTLSGNVFADNGNGADSEAKGETFTVTEVNGTAADVGNQITLASGALLTLNSDGTFNYDPNGQFESLNTGETANDSFTYTIADDKIGSNTATVNITINGANEPLVANDDTATTDENSSISISVLDLLANDTDLEADTLTITAVNDRRTKGTVTFDGENILYNPKGEFEFLNDGTSRNDSFTYTISDGNGNTASATVNITVNGVSGDIFATFPPEFNLSDLDGSNGFVINGIDYFNGFSGESVSNAGDVNGDGVDDVIIGAGRANSNSTDSGESYVVFGSKTGFDSSFNLSDLDGSNGFILNSSDALDYSGFTVSNAGDINGDGIDDLIIGARRDNPNGTDSGKSYVVFGSSSGFSRSFELSTLDGSNGFVINGIDAVDAQNFFGLSVSSAGDVNGDGIDDLIIGARRADPNGIDRAGESYVVFGSSSGFNSSFELSTLDGSNGFVINGIDATDFSGYSVSSAGDINGDRIDDLIISAPLTDPNANGESYVVFGSSSGFGSSFNLSDLDGSNGFVINGIDTNDFSGEQVSSAGDINADGVDDLIIGARGADPNGEFSGESYVVFGSSSGIGNSLNLSDLDGSNGFVINGIDTGDSSGRFISNAGDINGDGIDDLIIGAYFADPNGENSGESYVVFGSSSAFGSSLELSTLDGSNGFVINGIDAGDQSGSSVSNAGDINGDGVDDLIIGAFLADPNGQFNAGESYVVFGVNYDEPPTFTSEPEFQVAENTQEVGTITATDVDNDDLTFSITDGKDKELFAIDPSNGDLTFINSPNFDVDAETNYQVQVSVSDSTQTVSQDLTVNLTAVDEPPIIEDTTFFVGTNSTSGTTIGMVTATDPENKELEFAITSGNIDTDGDSNEAFAIDSSTGIVTVNDIDDLDFGSTSSLNLEVTATDADNLTDTANIAINLDDMGEVEKEFLNLSDVTGQISVSVEIQREAAFDNLIGFYQITDANGGIDTNGDGVVDFNPGDAGYKEAALNNRITGLDLLQTDNQTTSTFNGTLEGGTILAPFMIVDGTFDEALNGSAEVYFSFLGANSDGFDHIRSLGSENTFGFEDLPNGGDLDYNDVILRVEY